MMSILHTDFTTWARNYSGPKFNLLHIDCATWQELEDISTYSERFLAPSAHAMLWTLDHPTLLNFLWYLKPLIWLKSNVKDRTQIDPTDAYETCAVGVRGARPLVKSVVNAYAAPESPRDAKPEPMLRKFMAMFVDEHTRMLDPNCGRGSALRAADSLGAKFVLGLTPDATLAKEAHDELTTARALRKVSMEESLRNSP